MSFNEAAADHSLRAQHRPSTTREPRSSSRLPLLFSNTFFRRKSYGYEPIKGFDSDCDKAQDDQLQDDQLSYDDPDSIQSRPNPVKNLGILGGLYAAANTFYILSLRGAPTPQEMNHMLGLLGFFLVVSVALFSFQFWTATTILRIPRRWRSANALLQLITISVWYMMDGGNRLDKHGSFNLLIFCVILVPTNSLVAFLYFWYYASSSVAAKRARRFSLQLFAAVFAATLLIFVVARRKQSALAYGFFDKPAPCSASQRDAETCKSCQWTAAIPWFDLLPFRVNVFTGPMTCPKDDTFSAAFTDDNTLVVTCDASQTEVKSWLNDSVLLTHSDAIFVELPRTEIWGLPLKEDSLEWAYNPLQKRILRYAEDRLETYDGPTTVDKNTDTVLVFCGSTPMKIVTRIIPAAGMEEDAATDKSSLDDDDQPKLNVITLFVDAVSRRQIHRRLPMTRQVLEASVTASNATSELFEFFRYHTVGLNTGPNTRAMWAGLNEQTPLATGVPLWEQYQSAGYASARIDPMCQDWVAYYDAGHLPNGTAKQLERPRIAHEHIAWSCFPPYLPIGKENGGNFAGPTSIKARCLSGTHVGWHELDWASDFISHYRRRGRPHHLNAAFMEGHEGSGEVLRTLDARLARFLDPATSPMDLNRTAVVLISDHGALMGLNNAFFQNGKTEAANPAAVMLLPSWFVQQDSMGERLREATGRLITAHDMYETMRGFMGPRRDVDSAAPRRGKDLLREHVGERSCAEAGITETKCQCLT